MTKLTSLMELTDETCRWPIGDPLEPGFGFCGDPTMHGSRYCEEHYHKSRGHGTESERTALKVAKSIARAA